MNRESFSVEQKAVGTKKVGLSIILTTFFCFSFLFFSLYSSHLSFESVTAAQPKKNHA